MRNLQFQIKSIIFYRRDVIVQIKWAYINFPGSNNTVGKTNMKKKKKRKVCFRIDDLPYLEHMNILFITVTIV